MIEAFLTPEFISLLGGSITGFFFRTLAEKRQDEQDRFNRMVEAIRVSDESQNKAVERVNLEAGKWVRRIIVLCILFGTILAPFILPFFNIPTVVEVVQEKYAPLDLFGLFGTNKVMSFETVKGFLFTQENRQILVTVVGFYFGSAVGKSR
jgi:hypothetical protein